MRSVFIRAIHALLVAVAVFGTCTPSAFAQPADAKAAIAGLTFLLGTWQNGTGAVADTKQTSTGRSTFSNEVNGAAIVRRDHTDLFGKDGKPAGSFDQLMMIYPENGTLHADYTDGTLHADYTDGTHVIHYVNATVIPGRSVEFDTAAPAGTPNYRLTYALVDPGTLSVRFEIAPPGSADFHPIATGSLTRGTI